MHQIPLFMTGLRKDFDWLDDMLRHKKVNRLAQLLQKWRVACLGRVSGRILYVQQNQSNTFAKIQLSLFTLAVLSFCLSRFLMEDPFIYWFDKIREMFQHCFKGHD